MNQLFKKVPCPVVFKLQNILAALLGLVLPSIAAADHEIPVTKISISGCRTYTQRDILDALCMNEPTVTAFRSSATPVAISEILRSQVQLGYRSAGFRDIKVDVTHDAKSDQWTLLISEGSHFVKGRVLISGLPDAEAEVLKAILSTDTKDDFGDAEIPSEITRWKNRASLSFKDPLDVETRTLVQEGLAVLGYPTAEFQIELKDKAASSATAVAETPGSMPLDLAINITNAGTPLKSGQIHFTGLTRHTPDQMLEYLQIQPGSSLTKTIRQQIAAKLIESGRFLKVEVRQDPLLFDPSEPLDLHIRVREYEGIVPLGQEVVGHQKTILKFAQSLSKWNQSDSDFSLTCSVPVRDVRDLVQSVIPNSDQVLFGNMNDGTCRINALISPRHGTAFDLRILDPSGRVHSHRTILAGGQQIGVIETSAQKKWLQEQLTAGVLISMGIDGTWDEEQPLSFNAGWQISSNLEPGLGVSLSCNPAAMMSQIDHQSVEEHGTISHQDGVLRMSLSEEAGGFSLQQIMEIDEQTGELRAYSISDGTRNLEIGPGRNLVHTLIAERTRESAEWPNLAESDMPWSSLLRMLINPDHDAIKGTEELKLVRLLTSLLENPRAMKSINDALTNYFDHKAFYIPRQSDPDRVPLSPWMSYAVLAGMFTPEGLLIHDAGKATSKSLSLNEPGHISELLDNVLKDESNGALNCLQASLLFSKSPQANSLFQAAIDRRSSEQFQHDIAPLIDRPSALRDSLFGLMYWVQTLTDDEIETLSKFTAENLREMGISEVQARAFFHFIRTYKEQPPEKCLKESLTLCWDSVLKVWMNNLLMNAVVKSKAEYSTKPVSLTRDSEKKTTDTPTNTPANAMELAPIDILKPLSSDSRELGVTVPEPEAPFDLKVRLQ